MEENKPNIDDISTCKREPKDGWNQDLNQDEAILAQERQIEKEIADNTPLISEKISIETLLSEYQFADQSYQKKIYDLMKEFKFMRRTRPDGNCFFRGFTYAYFEYLLTHEEELLKFIELVDKFKDMLIKVGFMFFTIEDFHDTFLSILNKIKDKEISTVDQLLEVFNDPCLSNYLVVYVRLITSGYLQTNSVFFENFIEGYESVKDFCSHEVEPMYKESDHIHITAITEATGISVSIGYLNRGDEEKVIFHNFPDNANPKIYLLFKPNHYDCIFRN